MQYENLDHGTRHIWCLLGNVLLCTMHIAPTMVEGNVPSVILWFHVLCPAEMVGSSLQGSLRVEYQGCPAFATLPSASHHAAFFSGLEAEPLELHKSWCRMERHHKLSQARRMMMIVMIMQM